MTALATCALLYLAATLLLSADRAGSRLPIAATRSHVRVTRLIALVATLGALWLWRRVEAGPAPYLLIPAGLLVMSIVVALLAPVRPKLVWGAALACALAVPLLAVGGLLR